MICRTKCIHNLCDEIPSIDYFSRHLKLKVSGEIIDTWYFITEIMYALGTADHRCEIWCVVGGISVSLKGNGGNSYLVLKMEGDATSVANSAEFATLVASPSILRTR